MRHKIAVKDKVRNERPGGKDQNGGVRPELTGIETGVIDGKRPLHEVVKQAHQNAACQGQRNSLGELARFAFLTLLITIGQRVENNSQGDERDTGKNKHWIAFWLGNVINHHALNQCDSNADGKSHSHARYMNGGSKKYVSQVKDKPAQYRPFITAHTALGQIVNQRSSSRSERAEGKAG